MASYNGLSVFLLTLITTTSCILVSSSSAQTVPALFVFGDSLVDVGNNNHLPLSLLKADFPHNGVDYPGRKSTGRFSNGRNAADFIADKLGIPTSPPYLHYINLFISCLAFPLQNIYNLGGRKFAFVGVGPIGCSPAKRNGNSAGDCEEDINSMCTMYNEAVKSLFSSMKTDLPDMSYSFFDTYVADLEYIQNPSKYGFVEVKAACCGLGHLNAKIACTPISTYCPNRKDHLFWDFYHPTETVSHMLSDTAFDGSPPSVNPINIRQLVGL
ncbi:GDSL esterase/lipase [Acorus gramineus]|uniref:GDSL esterase/lipase n=1 Tax=Acorus gramineus TaxID=55184 RepID=A0AAV9BTM0_ACOGR|nr:GDSL esterase/lipase [Acorus gramineus]KAK1280051.1 GDSL esterase/lipase [Acorus gramineus]